MTAMCGTPSKLVIWRASGIDPVRRRVPTIDGTDSGEEREMSKIADVSEPASELERLIAELSESGLLVFVFGDGW